MKVALSLLLLAVTLSPVFARADDDSEQPKPLPALSVDLDGDGQPETVRIVPGNDEFDVLELQYTASNKSFRFERLAPHFTQENCHRMGWHELAKGPGNTILWTLNQGGMDDCRYERKTTLQIGIDYGPWSPRVERASVQYHSWSMGGPAPKEEAVYDFVGRTLEVSVEEHREGNVSEKRRENLRAGCVAGLANLGEQELPLPVCARMQSKFMISEIYAEAEGKGIAVCPSFEGSYICKRRFGNDDHSPTKSRVLVIQRTEGRFPRYDVSDHSRIWITDGRKRKAPAWEADIRFFTATCRRDELRGAEESWLKLNHNDPRKPLYDRRPVSRQASVWTQLDLEGNHFAYREVSQYLNDDGSYRTTEPTTMDCVREKAPE